MTTRAQDVRLADDALAGSHSVQRLVPHHGRTHLDLFSGIGGFAIAAQNCGYTTIGFCEREPYAQQILKERFGAVLADADERRSEQRNTEKRRLPKPHACNPRLHPDIFNLNGADYAGVDLLTGGFPCQPFSVAGKRKGAADDRAIWPEMLRVIREAQPTWIIGENVAGIVTMELDNILSDLEGIVYAAWPLVIPACAVDARHRRDRVWIVAHAASKQDDGKRGHRERGRDGMGRHEQAARRRNGQADNNSTGGQGEDVAHADEPGSQGRHGAELRERGGERASGAGGSFCSWPAESDWFPQSPICRVAHGIPNRSHRLRGLGNAIVPQVAEEIIRNLQY